MAGAGYKLFNTGDVLTAAQVNTYLQEQTVMVFANSTARTTALSGVLAEGMVTYLKDTDAVEKYNGSAWVSIGGSASPLTTKGDLYTYSTADARLAVGNNGEQLVANSTATTGLSWAGNFAAGRNRIINGDFNVNQRGFSSTGVSDTYGFDRWLQQFTGGTCTYSSQSFTAGTAPVAGYEAKNFARLVTASQSAAGDYAYLVQRLESVRTFANQTVNVSFWAKAASGTPKISIEFTQYFGSGGSPSSVVRNYIGQVTLSTSWTRYSVSASIASISGKTLGTANDDWLGLYLWVSGGSDFNARTNSIGIQNGTFDFWGVQVEAGSVATPFQTATGTLAGELAACQRYYFFSGQDISFSGNVTSGSTYYGLHFFPVTMRIAPTVTLTNANGYRFPSSTGTAVTFTNLFRESRVANSTGDGNFGSTYTASAEL